MSVLTFLIIMCNHSLVNYTKNCFDLKLFFSNKSILIVIYFSVTCRKHNENVCSASIHISKKELTYQLPVRLVLVVISYLLSPC